MVAGQAQATASKKKSILKHLDLTIRSSISVMIMKNPVPNAYEELVLKQYSENEKDNSLDCHSKQVLPYKIPCQWLQCLLVTCGQKNLNIIDILKDIASN